MTNLFPLPYWALASERVPRLFPVREERWSLIGWLSCQRIDFWVSGSGNRPSVLCLGKSVEGEGPGPPEC